MTRFETDHMDENQKRCRDARRLLLHRRRGHVGGASAYAVRGREAEAADRSRARAWWLGVGGRGSGADRAPERLLARCQLAPPRSEDALGRHCASRERPSPVTKAEVSPRLERAIACSPERHWCVGPTHHMAIVSRRGRGCWGRDALSPFTPVFHAGFCDAGQRTGIAVVELSVGVRHSGESLDPAAR